MSPRVWLTVSESRLFPGYSSGLAEPTAIVDLESDQSVTIAGAAEQRIRAGALGLCPEHRFFGIAESDWPRAFLVAEPGRPGSESRLGDWVVALTVALQRWSLQPVWRGRVVSADPGRLTLAVPWQNERIFAESLRLAVSLVEQWSQPEPDEHELQTLIGRFRGGLGDAQRLGVSGLTLRHIQAAVHRGIPFQVRPDCIRLGWGCRSLDMAGNTTGHTGLIAALTAENKFATKCALAEAELPQPAGSVVPDLDRATQLAAELGWPVVVKPLSLSGGKGVVPGIRDTDTLRRAFETADRLSPGGVIVEKHVDGDDFRMLVVRGELLAVARRDPGGVTGDGVHTVAELVDEANTDPRRTDGVYAQMRKLTLDDAAVAYLAERNLAPGSVPVEGHWVPLRRTANISTGGSAFDFTADVHPDNRLLAQRAARVLGLDIAGVDFLTTDITRSWREVGGAITEININPSPAIHWLADVDRDLNGEILDLLFAGRPTRIPTAGLLGTGATETADLLHAIWVAAGVRAGVCTSAGTRIGDELIASDDLAGLPGGRLLLEDPGVEAAVIELTAESLNTLGHPCDRYDVAALLTAGDGTDPAAELLARAAAVVINADDSACLAMGAAAGTPRRILVTRDPDNPEVSVHRSAGGEAVFIAEHSGGAGLHFACGAEVATVWPVPEGTADADSVSTLFATAVAAAQGLPLHLVGSVLGRHFPVGTG